jgi:hypothetical protein
MVNSTGQEEKVRIRGYVLLVNIAAALLGGCTTVNLSAPMSSNIGGNELARPDPSKFRGQPVVRLTFVSDIDPIAESELLDAYMANPVGRGRGPESSDVQVADYFSAELNLNGMVAKNTFYSFQLAKYLKMKADGDYTMILNPVKLKYDLSRGFYYEPFEDQLPPHDVEVNFLAYVHPNTHPSTKGQVVTTHGDSLAPIVSVRVDPQFNPEADGAIALTRPMVRYARDPDGFGTRGQLADYLNGLRIRVPNDDLEDKSQGSGALKPGRFFELDISTFELSRVPPPEHVVPQATLSAWNYYAGTYDAYEFFEGYHKIVLAALQQVDNTAVVTAAQRNYWSFYDSADLSDVMVEATDRSKRSFLMGAKTAELTYLSNQNDNWMNAVLETQNFSDAFNNLRDAEQLARKDYVDAEIRRGVGVLVAILGAVAIAKGGGGSNMAAIGGGAVGFGISLVVDATSRVETIDENFELAYQSSYEDQKTYVFETAEGERVSVVGRDYNDFKQTIKSRYEEKYLQNDAPGSQSGVPSS